MACKHGLHRRPFFRPSIYNVDRFDSSCLFLQRRPMMPQARQISFGSICTPAEPVAKTDPNPPADGFGRVRRFERFLLGLLLVGINVDLFYSPVVKGE
ncbi:hypothetical protein SDJN03_04715, partial [Cucurbita argyrosperma subsp. sororia]